MAAADDNTFDLDPPRRPSLDDCGGAGKEDDVEYPPDPLTHPTAAEFNLFARMIAVFGGVLPHTFVDVRINAGAPVIDAAGSFRTSVTTATFTPTDNGTGDTTIAWPADTFPTAIGKPVACITSSSGDYLEPNVDVLTNSFRVKTKDKTGALADVAFKVLFY
jgi:hypothetical protein